MNPWITHIVSDASNTGWRAVFFPPSGNPFAVAGTWTETAIHDHINVKELRALILATQYVPRSSTILISLDNTTAISVIKKTRSNSYQLNSLLVHLLPWFKIRSVEYNTSAENIAGVAEAS